jgi:hypothetical protein
VIYRHKGRNTYHCGDCMCDLGLEDEAFRESFEKDFQEVFFEEVPESAGNCETCGIEDIRKATHT